MMKASRLWLTASAAGLTLPRLRRRLRSTEGKGFAAKPPQQKRARIAPRPSPAIVPAQATINAAWFKVDRATGTKTAQAAIRL
ncbi:hypothetical protein U91I_00050 [alpha proteobacterium U9-1i]|nr:hypothetical protein U91I_00050 [alpha proteobacterium U9-1i]